MAPKHIPLILMAWLVMTLTGCLPFVTGPSISGFQAPSERIMISGVPFIPDDSSHCGPSTLAAVMTFRGRETTKEEVAVEVQREDLRGSLGPDLVIWAREKGMAASFTGSSPDKLIAAIKSGQPVILLIDSGLGLVHKGHFLVAVGYGPEGLVVNTGQVQQQILPWRELLTDWRKMGNFAIFVTGLAPATGSAQGPGASAGEPVEPQVPREVLLPARVPQAMNLPVGLDLPEDLSTVSPYESIPTTAKQGTPTFLTGTDLPDPKTRQEKPIIDISGHPDADIADPAEDAEDTDSDQLTVKKGAAPGEAVVMEPLPTPEGGSEAGIRQKDLGPPLILPVVPLPEEQPITGSRMGSDFKGPATVPGARTPGQATGSETGTAKKEAGTKAGEQGDKVEQDPVMSWER
jgi:hypothetical protein